MVLIVTSELLNVPANILGVVFGTNTRTNEGLMIVNPGIITSGHQSRVTFYALNLSKSYLPIEKNSSIARVVFFKTTHNNVTPTKPNKSIEFSAEEKAEALARTRLFPSLKEYFVQSMKRRR